MMNESPVYMDYAASSPMDQRVIKFMMNLGGLNGVFANPDSDHLQGRKSAQIVEKARCQLGTLLNADKDRIIWTSGATESNNIAIQGAAFARASRGKHLITMLTEHKAVTDTFKALEKRGFEVTWLSPNNSGLLVLETLLEAIRPDTQLVSIMHINNETGVVQDIYTIGNLCRNKDILFHCDAAQSIGKIEIDLDKIPIDLLSITAHKIYGPPGIGALYVSDRPACGVLPIMFGGSQEKKIRPGTLPVHQIAGFGLASEIAIREMHENLDHVKSIRNKFLLGMKELSGIKINGDLENSYPGILNISAPGIDGESLIFGLEPLCVARGSACNSTNNEPSHVLKAMGNNDLEAQSAIRFSFGPWTNNDEVNFAIKKYKNVVEKLRNIALV